MLKSRARLPTALAALRMGIHRDQRGEEDRQRKQRNAPHTHTLDPVKPGSMQNLLTQPSRR